MHHSERKTLLSLLNDHEFLKNIHKLKKHNHPLDILTTKLQSIDHSPIDSNYLYNIIKEIFNYYEDLAREACAETTYQDNNPFASFFLSKNNFFSPQQLNIIGALLDLTVVFVAAMNSEDRKNFFIEFVFNKGSHEKDHQLLIEVQDPGSNITHIFCFPRLLDVMHYRRTELRKLLPDVRLELEDLLPFKDRRNKKRQ
jgi:hypothetical protein